MPLPKNSCLTPNSRKLRKAMTKPERQLWFDYLKKGRPERAQPTDKRSNGSNGFGWMWGKTKSGRISGMGECLYRMSDGAWGMPERGKTRGTVSSQRSKKGQSSHLFWGSWWCSDNLTKGDRSQDRSTDGDCLHRQEIYLKRQEKTAQQGLLDGSRIQSTMAGKNPETVHTANFPV